MSNQFLAGLYESACQLNTTQQKIMSCDAISYK